MPIRIDHDYAESILRDAARGEFSGPVFDRWREKFEAFSEICRTGKAKTHVAFLGTEVLAKAVDIRVDLYAIKPTHAPEGREAHSYSARPLSEKVLVPLSAELEFDIGVSGRQPLNNQPYFRMSYLGDQTPVHAASIEAFNAMVELIDELAEIDDSMEARTVLAAFIAVRRGFVRNYGENLSALERVDLRALTEETTKFVNSASEGGKRAQAVVAGLLEALHPDRVISGRVNDPDRREPGDVCVATAEDDQEQLTKAFEVRDKPVSDADAIFFCRKCLDQGVYDAAIVMASNTQVPLNRETLSWARERGINLRLFYGIDELIEEVTFWAAMSSVQIGKAIVSNIEKCLIAVEVQEASVEEWRAIWTSEDD